MNITNPSMILQPKQVIGCWGITNFQLFAFLVSAGTSYNGSLLLTGRNDEMKAEGWKLGIQWYLNLSLVSVRES